MEKTTVEKSDTKEQQNQNDNLRIQTYGNKKLEYAETCDEPEQMTINGEINARNFDATMH